MILVVDDVEGVVVDVVRGTEVGRSGSSTVVVVGPGRVALVVVRGASVGTGTRTAGTSSVGGGGSGRTHR